MVKKYARIKETLGTARTLDGTSGFVRLQDGIIGEKGVAVMEDNSLILGSDGMPRPRAPQKDYCSSLQQKIGEKHYSFFMQ